MSSRSKKWVVISIVISFATGVIYGCVRVSKIISKEMKRTQNRLDLFEGFYRPMKEWFAKEQAGNSLAKFLESRQYNKIGIYGMGDFANRIYDALKDSSIEVVCSMDENKSAYSDTVLLTFEDDFPEMDAVIITDFRNGDSIMERLSEKGNFDMLLLDDIIYNEL